MKLVESAGGNGYYRSWWVEDIESNERWEEPVPENEMGDPLNAMEVLAVMTELE